MAMKVLLGPRRPVDPREVEFDRRYGTDTAGYIPLSDLDVKSDNWMQGCAYQGIGTEVDLSAVLPPLRFEDYTFVDLGAGKGRAVLLALRLPFKEVIGVEFSATLAQIAHSNTRRWPPAEFRAGACAIVCKDVTEYTLPAGPLVVFIYNAFGPALMEAMAARAAGHDDRVVIAYFTPKHPQPWDARFERVSERPGVIVWQSRA
jgi:SAM-dependent methyltransferase